MKKILLAVMILTVFCSLNVFAEEVIEGELEISLETFPTYTPLEYMPSFFSSESEYDKMVDGLSKFQTVFEFDYVIPYPDGANQFEKQEDIDDYIAQYVIEHVNLYFSDIVVNYYYNAIFNNPQFMHAATTPGGGEFSYPKPKTGEDITLKIYFYPRYIITEEQYAQAISNADGIIADIIEPEMTDEEKVLVLHDYIIDTTDYNTEYANTIGRPSTAEHWQNHTAYGVFVNGKAVCQGYALAYNFLLNRVGIENKYVSGTANGGAHGWCAVKINNNWYHVDATHDDPSNDQCADHNHFLLSDTQIYALGHRWDATVECNDDKYGMINYCFHGMYNVNGVDDSIHYKDGYFYGYRHLHLDVELDHLGRIISSKLASEYNYTGNKEISNVLSVNIDGQKIYFTCVYVKSNFDGSAFEIITEEEYNNAFIEQYEYDINPIYVNENGVAEEITLNNIGDSTIYIKNEKDTQYNPDVYVVFYDGNGKVISSSYFSSEGKNVSVDISTVKPSEEFARFSLFVWADGTLIPMAENYTVE